MINYFITMSEKLENNEQYMWKVTIFNKASALLKNLPQLSQMILMMFEGIQKQSRLQTDLFL